MCRLRTPPIGADDPCDAAKEFREAHMEQWSKHPGLVENKINMEPSGTGHLIKNDDANQAFNTQAIKPPSKQARNLVKRFQDASQLMP